MEKYFIALIQMCCTFLDTQSNITKAMESIETAAKKGAKLVCLPEGFFTGYSADELDKAIKFAEPQNGEVVSAFRMIACKYKIFILVPLFERTAEGIKNSAVLINDDGDIEGKYSKTHLVDGEKECIISGCEFPVWDTKLGKIACAICYDLCFPEIIRKEVQAGAELVLVPAAWRANSYYRRWWDITTECRALDNLVYIAAVNQVGRVGNTVFAGRSKICDPIGCVICQASDDEEEIIYAEIDLHRIEEERAYNTVLKDFRDELFYS